MVRRNGDDMITQTYKLDMIPTGLPVVVHVSQYDTTARTLAFELYAGGETYSPDGVVTIRGTKPDDTVFEYTMIVEGNTASIALQPQMAIAAGDVATEIKAVETDGTVNSANFIIRVEKSAVDDNTAISDSDIPVFTQLAEQAESAATAAQTAQAATEALFPTGGTVGQYLQKTANGTQWSDAGGGDLRVTITSSSSGRTSDKTFAEIEEAIANGGTPYAMNGTDVYLMATYRSGNNINFDYYTGNFRKRFTVASDNSVEYTVTRQTATNITYDNTTSGLTAETVQAAIDEIVTRLS